MDLMHRRREMMSQEATSPYPFESDYPEFNEYGKYLLTVIEKSGTNTNMFLQSGTTKTAYAGGVRIGALYEMEITISESEIKIVAHYNGYNNSTWKKVFYGFPVKIKLCAGSENDAPKATFRINKED